MICNCIKYQIHSVFIVAFIYGLTASLDDFQLL